MNASVPPRRARLWIAALAVLLGGPALAAPATSPGTAPSTLKEAFRDDFLVGASISYPVVSGQDAVAQALVIQQFNTVTSENELKPERLLPSPGVFDFSKGDAYVEFGRKHGMFVVGHTLLWHIQTPPWLFVDAHGKPNGADAQIEQLRSYIEHVAGRYAGGRVQAWDVANEVLDEDGSYRQSPWLKNVGDGDRLLREAFRFAARYAPDTELYYNDFNTETPAKRAGIVRMVKMLQAAGLRIDGIGMQGHWGIDGPAIAEIEETIDTFAALGVKVMITELDVDVLPKADDTNMPADQRLALPKDPVQRRKLDPWPQGLPAEMQQKLAKRYADLFALFHRKRDAIARVTFWNVHDGASWKNDYPVQGRTNYPLLFDRQGRPKPAFDAVMAVPAQAADDK